MSKVDKHVPIFQDLLLVQQLFDASRLGNLAIVKQLLVNNNNSLRLDVNWRNVTEIYMGWRVSNAPALIAVAANCEKLTGPSVDGNDVLEIMKLLIDNGANVNAKESSWGSSALHAAASLCQRPQSSAILNLLLDRGAAINETGDAGWSALIEAADQGRTETVGLLLDRGANINERTKYGDTALTMAASRRKRETARLLMNRGADRSGCMGSPCI